MTVRSPAEVFNSSLQSPIRKPQELLYWIVIQRLNTEQEPSNLQTLRQKANGTHEMERRNRINSRLRFPPVQSDFISNKFGDPCAEVESSLWPIANP